VTLAGQEIQRNVRRLVSRWRGYEGTERAEAQTFVNELFAAYGTDRQAAGVRFEQDQRRPSGAHGFIDAWWPGRLLIEVKRPTEAGHLERHREQALEYWRHSSDPATDRPAVDYVVLCAFGAFEVWQPGRHPLAPRAALTLDELPDRYEALLFLGGQRPLFLDADRSLTTEAAERTVALYRSLADRDAAHPDALMGLVLQTVWCLFASSLGMLPGHPVRVIVESLLADDAGWRSTSADLGFLFESLARQDLRNQGGLYAHAVYVNGGLFRAPARVHLERGELELLAEAAAFDWSQVEPTIFGSLLEGFLPRRRAIATGGQRSQFGVHYTHEADILKIVQPTIVEPWTERIEEAATVDEAVEALTRLCSLRVLDPACGSGNFLYVAYRELRDLEALARERVLQLAAASGLARPSESDLPQFPLANLHGIDVDAFAVRVARLVLWMGHKLASDRHGTPEPPLPLPDLDDSIVAADALWTQWPAADVIIGNPPFNGSQQLRGQLGDEYVARLQREFESLRDYCTYWFRRTAERLPDGGRAGLVGTNSVAQGRGREAGLDHVVAAGGVITNAVSSQVWPGEANVHVSIVNWVQRPATPPLTFVLDDEEVPEGIAADLWPTALSTIGAKILPANDGLSFQGMTPGNEGFVISAAEAGALQGRRDARYADVVRPYLSGGDIPGDPYQRPSRWVIDFGMLPLEDAERWPAALDIVRERVRPTREHVRRQSYRRYWWRFVEPRPGLRTALSGLPRWLATSEVGRRTLFAWCNPLWLPNNKTVVMALGEDYHFGVLTSAAHVTWARYRGSTLKADPAYTPTTVFATFPWPEPDDGQRGRIAAAAREVVAQRVIACDGRRGLTTVYNLMDDGGFVDLAAAHRELDAAVADAYGWPAGALRDPYQLIPRLMARNAEIARGERRYDPFPGRRRVPVETSFDLGVTEDG